MPRLAERITAQYSTYGEIKTAEKSVNLKSLKSVFRAGWSKPAARRLQGRNKFTVEPDECYAQMLHLSIPSLPSA